MLDDKTERGSQDRSRIAMDQDYEVDYWTWRFAVSRETLRQAVDAVGHSAEAVKRNLHR